MTINCQTDSFNNKVFICEDHSIKEDRLNGLMLFNIHRDIKITPDEVIEEFSKKHTRKLQLQYM
ncbi:52 kDa repressor of the inhibitor of the protein kinase-like [Aphis craccivora]|uniref:52 kDa repressor of the inhibitor of the protein kinase-like n=1 Tax=Aphis craccivora TaxID=307492 RepID=A0A6G0WF86_APHCR|nr:52 kDa repressor of the inhibitor of the protein kinase-like [Aphis craccivora]